MIAATLMFCVGILLGVALGYRAGWNAHIDYKLTEAIEKAEAIAAEERK